MKKLILLALFFGLKSASAQDVGIELFAEGFNQPLEIVNAGDSRLFVVEKGGAIKILNADGTVNATPFLTILASQLTFGVERGLLGMVFHPDYATNGRFYVCYTRAPDGAVTVMRYTRSVDPNIANPNSATPIIIIPHPIADIHNGGTLRFGPDGYLYMSVGDGGWPPSNASDITTNLGKILRIDVNNPGGGLAYSSPTTNPYVGTLGNDEIWARGLRNPWKFSFDSLTGDLWISDVGQSAVEEINHATIDQAGLHYGWICMEGSSVYSEGDCAEDMSIYTLPVVEYPHGEGSCSITGGYVYRGNEFPTLQGYYFFTDFCRSRIGRVNVDTYETTFTADLPDGPYSFTSFGQDVNGELYLASHGPGKIYKLVDNDLAVNNPDAFSFTVSPNPAARQAQIKLAPEAVPATAQVYDLTGKILLKKTLRNETSTLDISTLQKGVYIVDVIDSNGQSSQVKLAKI
jgi:glucose/arabinose dehydrogenase